MTWALPHQPSFWRVGVRSFFEVAEGAAFGEGAVEFGADGGEDVHLHGFGDGEGGGVFLAPDVAVVKGGGGSLWRGSRRGLRGAGGPGW